MWEFSKALRSQLVGASIVVSREARIAKREINTVSYYGCERRRFAVVCFFRVREF